MGEKIDLNEKQLTAVRKAADFHLSIVNGGAGVGKTATTAAMADELELNGHYGVELCAFAGKAAARLREATGRDAKTIHRLLGYNGKDFTVKNLKGKAVIVDEASMVPSDLLAKICLRGPARLILVGDEAQLPPVGMGQPFHDLIRQCPDIVTTLDICYRNRAAVNKAATAIRNGGHPLENASEDGETYDLTWCQSPEQAHSYVLDLVKRGELDFTDGRDIILTPRNGKEETEDGAPKERRKDWNDPLEDADMPAGTVRALNRDILQLVNPHPAQRFAQGDRVMVTKNNAALDVWNGTTATIEAVTDKKVYLLTDLPCHPQGQPGGEMPENRKVILGAEDARELVHAYALSVHKSQGSQYRRVVFLPLNRDAHTLLDRRMIYTAVTRTRERCSIIGQQWAYCHGIDTAVDKTGCIPYIDRMGIV